MPYNQIKELPDNVKKNLPDDAQEIYKEAYNSAWDQYKDEEDRRSGKSREETAHSVAWSAVKNKYTKGPDGNWTKK